MITRKRSRSPGLLPISNDCLIISESGRALAGVAVQAGYTTAVIDRFGDDDTRRIAASVHVYRDPATDFANYALLKSLVQASGLTTAGCIVTGSGFDSCPRVLEALAVDYPVMGNRARTIREIKDPDIFFPALDRLGIHRPNLSRNLPANNDHWLCKRVGGSGGGHIQDACLDNGEHTYYQQYIAGSSYSLVFLADGRHAVSIGLNKTWCRERDPHPYRFGGALAVPVWDLAGYQKMNEIIRALTRHFGLYGLCGLDFVVSADDGEIVVLEVNPRPTATLSLHETNRPLFSAHIEAFQGRLVEGIAGMPGPQPGMQILYADRDFCVPDHVDWPLWAADIPGANQAIKKGEPCCTVYAEGSDITDVRELLDERCRTLERSIFRIAASC